MRQQQNIGNNTTFSRVVLAVPMQNKWVKPEQSHKDITAHYQINKPLHMFFNDILSKPEQYDIYGFLRPNYWFNHDYAMERIVEKFNEYPHICAIYTDFVDKKPIYLSPYDPKIQPLNTSLFINSKFKNIIKFPAENMFEAVMLNIMHQGLLTVHIAEQLLCKYE